MQHLSTLFMVGAALTVGIGCGTAGDVASPSALPAAAVATPPARPRTVTIEGFSDAGLTNGSRTIRIHLPSGYERSRDAYPVFYFHDGPPVFTSPDPKADPNASVRLDQVHDQLVAEGLIRPAILVAVSPGPAGRDPDLIPPSPSATTQPVRQRGNIEGYHQFLATVLKPYIDAHYRTLPEACNTGVVGFSLGGLGSCYLGHKHPETFGMVGCMSPSLGWGRGSLIEMLEKTPPPAERPRFWFDCASREGDDMWQPAMMAARALIANGWVEGKNVAFYMDYPGAHDGASWHRRGRSMFLYFVPRTPPKLTGIAIKHVQDAQGKPISLLAAGEQPYPTLELTYEQGMHLNAVNVSYSVGDPSLVGVDNSRFGALTNLARGKTTVSGSYGKLSATQTVETYGPQDYPQYPKESCARVARGVVVDGDLSDWGELPFGYSPMVPGKTDGLAATGRFRIGTAYDDRYVYLAVAVTDAQLFLNAKRDPWQQDGIEVRFDARPDPIRSAGQGLGEGDRFLLLAASPGEEAGTSRVHRKDALPPGVEVACCKTATGFAFEAAIPVAYMDRMQQRPWQEFRLNVCVNDAQGPDGPVNKYWWHPDWRLAENVPGSGSFAKK